MQACLKISVLTFLLLLLFVFTYLLFADLPVRDKEWYEQKAAYLRNLEITEETVTAAQEEQRKRYNEETLKALEADWGTQCLWIERDQLFPFKNGEWFYVVHTSFHEREFDPFLVRMIMNIAHRENSPNAPVRDAILGLGSNGKLYFNTQHPCSGVTCSFETPPESLEEFLSANNNHKHPWRVYEGYATVAKVKQ